MGKQARAPGRSHKFKAQSINSNQVAQAMLRRVDQRSATSGMIKVPAVPSLLDYYVDLCAALFTAAGRGFTADEREQACVVIADRLHAAFSESPRSKIVVKFEAEPGRTLGYEVKADISSIADAYERWIGTSDKPLFGTHPDARVWSLAETFSDPRSCPMLDLGAGTGRNAIALARRGHPVDAVEITPKFADMIATAAIAESLPINVIVCDAFHDRSPLRRDYCMLFASEVVPDFRGVEALRQLFSLAADVLADDGLLVFNVHLTAPGYTPDKAVREFAQQCYSALFTPNDLMVAAAGMPFALVSNDSVHDFEREHLPSEAWPPTPWYVNWVSGLDVLELERDLSPIELRWLVFKKVTATEADLPAPAPAHLLSQCLQKSRGPASKSKPLDAAAIRKALLQRLKRRWLGSGSFSFPAIPQLRDHFARRCLAMFDALGRKPDGEQLQKAGQMFERVLDESFACSARSNIVVNYDAPMGTELRYTVAADAMPLTAVYEDWLEHLPAPLFGEHPDARLVALLDGLGTPADCPVLDAGAGTGRNALYLAERGYRVDAVEITPKLADLIREQADSKGLAVRVVTGDLFERLTYPDQPYSLCLASGLVSDFRDVKQLRQFCELANSLLMDHGLLAMSVHLAVQDYHPHAGARQWAQQCCAMFFTHEELTACTAGLDFELISDESAFAFESVHSPEHAFPPTPAYSEWATCEHMFALPSEQCPVELRWLVFRKRAQA